MNVFKGPIFRLLGLTAAVLGMGLFLFSAFHSQKPEFSGRTNPERIAFLEHFGWEVQPEPTSSGKVRIPFDFDEVYLSYNQIQQKQGFDLEKYAGKTVDRYQYAVENYLNYEGEVRANLLVSEGKIIGGDICSTNFAGFIHEIIRKTEKNTVILHIVRKKSAFC